MEDDDKKSAGMFDPKPRSAADVPKPKQINYETAAAMAWEELRSKDLSERAKAAGCEVVGGAVVVPILGAKLTLDPSSESATKDNGAVVEPWEIIIALHCLLKATGAIPAGKLISYKEIPDGLLYWPNFVKRSVNLVLKTFGADPERLMAVASELGGRSGSGADVCVVIDALPRVPITIQLWRGDDEFPAEATILLDATITDYLPTEDITVLCQMMAIKLMMLARKKP